MSNEELEARAKLCSFIMGFGAGFLSCLLLCLALGLMID